MASLLERMNIDTTGTVGPVRNKSNRGGASPYVRQRLALLLRPTQWLRKHTTTSVAIQTVWAALTWAVWVAATATMTRVLPLLTPQANCAGADYCKQLKAALSAWTLYTYVIK